MNYPVTALEIPATKETPVIQFDAILEKQTNCSLMPESFYKEYIAIRAAGGPYYLNCSLKSQKISHCIFQNALGKLRNDANWKNRSDYELTPPPLTTDPVADASDERPEIREIMTFSVLGSIYKSYPHLVQKARLAIEAFKRTPTNAQYAVLW